MIGEVKINNLSTIRMRRHCCFWKISLVWILLGKNASISPSKNINFLYFLPSINTILEYRNFGEKRVHWFKRRKITVDLLERIAVIVKKKEEKKKKHKNVNAFLGALIFPVLHGLRTKRFIASAMFQTYRTRHGVSLLP